MFAPEGFKPTALYRPTKDGGRLRKALQASWMRRGEALQPDATKLAEYISSQVEAQFPAADMAVLQRYGATKIATSCELMAYVETRADWSLRAHIKIHCLVPGPDQFWPSYYVGGPYWDESNNWGCNPEYWGALDEEYREKIRQGHRARSAARLPADMEAIALRLCEAHRDSQFECGVGFADVLYAFKAEHGRYPKWCEMPALFPVLTEATGGETVQKVA